MKIRFNPDKMKVFTEVEALQKFLSTSREEGKSIGFVPTMGALHQGHASLINNSLKENDITICSVFVNALQFNNSEDLKRYPRNLNKDIDLLEQTGCDVLFAPEHKEIYPKELNETYDFGDLDKVMEGSYRPGHFKGVATVVNRFFEIVHPNRAYFGMKDYQQLVIIKKLVNLKGFDIQIIACPTERNENGLALSSRNELLTEDQKLKASKIIGWLNRLKEARGKRPLKEVKQEVIDEIEQDSDFKLEYLEVAHPDSLKPIENWNESDSFVSCVAIYLGSVRLIDNVLF